MTIAAVLLAAGRSERFGPVPKQLIDFDGEPLVRRVAREACNSLAEDVIAVLGCQADSVEKALSGLPLRTCSNPEYATGLAGSVRVGIACLAPDTRAALFINIDQPFLTCAVIDSLIRSYQGSGAPIVAPFFGERRGSPVLFDRQFFQDLSLLQGESGGREIIRRHPQMVEAVRLDSELPLCDVDTRGDYERLLRYTSSQDEECSH